MTTPQAVTARYVSNLLARGRNNEYDIQSIGQWPIGVAEEVVGVYYTAQVTRLGSVERAAGATPSQAVQRALEKFGVTFR